MRYTGGTSNAARLSVIIPIYAAEPSSAELLRTSLRHLRASDLQDFEVFVVDDGSLAAAAIRAVIDEAKVQFVRLDERQGPAVARNAAARKATGDVLVFVDADTAVHPDTLSRIAKEFENDPDLDALMGSYDRNPAAPGRVSRFRNLLHSFVHHRSQRHTVTFWAGCGAVRASRFWALGGFDESFPAPSIEDVEFGLRLHEAGGKLELAPEIQVTHYKAWTFASMVRVDLFSRAIPWAGLMHRYPLPLDLNFTLQDRISAALVALAWIVTLIAMIHGGLWWLAPLICVAPVAVLNRRLFQFLARAGSWRESLLSFPLLLTYLTTCVVGLIWGFARAEIRRDRLLLPTVVAIGVTLFAIQVSSHAFESEFAGYPDESAHFVSGLMIYDYLTTFPRDPIAWAGQYYLHYPRVAIGHWPPGYHALEAVWFLILGPSRFTAMLLQWAIGAVALSMLYRLVRLFLPFSVVVAILALVIATPVFQESLEQTMADLCCLLWSVLVMYASVRLVQRQDGIALTAVVLCLIAAAMTKGTAAFLVPVPVLALLAWGRPIRIPIRWLLIAACGVLAAAGWYFAMGGVFAWGGMSTSVPWPGPLIGHLAGWGFLVVAILGLRRNSLALVAAAMIASMLTVTLVVRAAREDRHWIIVLPAILVLAGLGFVRFRSPWIKGLLLALGLVLYPYSWQRQPQSRFGDLLVKVKRPSRMLISSSGLGEGPWIAVVSLTEKRPSSFVVRATKVVSESSWNGEGYHLLAPTADAVLQRLDELALDTVVLDTPPVPSLPHHPLIEATMRNSPAWKECASGQNLLAYCRVTESKFPRQPLHLRVYGWDFIEQIPLQGTHVAAH
jgi:glycosyltransferase involved in cell wall biosynthesis